MLILRARMGIQVLTIESMKTQKVEHCGLDGATPLELALSRVIITADVKETIPLKPRSLAIDMGFS